MAKVKKDRLGQKLYRGLKKHPIMKNTIIMYYLVAFVILIVGYIIYLIAKETI